jgi:threonine dehydrogenase-like Zn-dependent dehydrogenase
MKAIAVSPGQKDSVHLADLPMPNGRGVLVRLLRCGVDGTDKEINAAEYGAAPDGYDFLTIGHENFGRVEAVGPNVSEFEPGDYVVATVRRRGSSIYDQIGTYDMTTEGLDNYRQLIDTLTSGKGVIKAFCNIAPLDTPVGELASNGVAYAR